MSKHEKLPCKQKNNLSLKDGRQYYEPRDEQSSVQSSVVQSIIITRAISHWIGPQSQTLKLSTDVDQESLETEFSIAMAIKNTVSSDFWSALIDC